MPPPRPPPPSSQRLLLLPIVAVFILLARTVSSDQISQRTALLAFQSAVGLHASLNWNLSYSPCSWQGVVCENGNVTVLRLPGVGLYGTIPAGTIGNLTSLRTLSLRFNSISGPLPPDLHLCSELRNLYLHHNRLSGAIPPTFFNLTNLVRLNLAFNNLSGTIPVAFDTLPRLATLYLQNNSFSGSIPPLDRLDLAQFNLSFNHLNGSIPIHLRSQPKDAFLGMDLCGGPLGLCPGESASPSPSPASGDISVTPASGHRKKKISGGAIAGIVIGCVVGVLLVAMLLILLCRRREEKGDPVRSIENGGVKPPEPERPMREKAEVNGRGFDGSAATAVATVGSEGAGASGSGGKTLVFFGGSAAGGRVFDLEDLLRASAEVLGKGTFGTAYKAVLESGAVVAVKRLKDVELQEGEFRERIEEVGGMSHPNLVPLRAYYFSKDEKLLVYDYMSMGSLSALLHGNRGSGRTPLNWEARSAIALAAARGIEYIHSRGPGVSHGNIKSSNILLSKSSDARVSDQGLAHLVNPLSLPTRVAGYRAPEVTDARRVSQKADVYSFGVLLLELLTGKAPQQALLNDEGVDLPRWVQSVVREEWTSEVFDLELLRYQNVEEEMVQLLQLAMDCAAQYPDNRPSMSEVVKRIEDICRSSMDPVDIEQQEHPTAEGQ